MKQDPPIGTARSEYDGAGRNMPAQEREAALQRDQARRTQEPEPPFGGAYSGSETSRHWPTP